jgi:hypothetical protein
MLDSRVLETAIGLTFLFLGLAMITTAIQEFIASALNLRAGTLASGLRQMLADGENGLAFYQKLITHPVLTRSGKKPSYISAPQFSTAVLSILSGGGAVARLPGSIDILVRSLPDTRYKQVLLSLLREGESDLSGFETRLQQWFDGSMDRVSGTYKRISQYISLGIGAVLAFGLQANAITIGYGLWYGQNSSLMKAADEMARSGSPTMAAALQGLSQYHLTPIWEGFPLTHATWTIWVLGCAATAIAISLGAPFWFDLLQNFINIRATGTKPASSTNAGDGR